MNDGSLAWLVLLRDLSAKSALLLLAAWGLTVGMRRMAAAARHLVWLLAFAGLAALPLLSLTLPSRPVPVLPAAPVVAPLVPPNALIDVVPDRQPAPSLPARTFPVRSLPPAPPAWPPFLRLLWLLGTALFAFPLIAGLTLAGRRIRRCSPVTDPATLALAAEAARRLGVRRPVALRSGPSVAVPVTSGLLRPVILLPDGAASWPAERLRVALLHELAHVRRGDWATQTMARLVCALFWHNPLVWPAARMLRAEAERACDDLVLSSGISAPDYAQHLLAVAAALSGAGRPLPLAIPMAGRGPLESRLCAVLTSRPRRAPSRRFAVLASVLAPVVLVPLAVLRPAARAALRMAPILLHAPAIIPALPKTVRHIPAPARAPVAAPLAPIPIKPTPTGVPPMKTLMPVKTVALAALAASLALPAAQAKPTAPVKPVPLPTVALPHMPLRTAPASEPSKALITIATTGDVNNGLKMLFQGSHRSYVIEPGVSGIVDVNLNAVPFDAALTTLVSASSQPLEWSIERGVYHIRPRALHAGEIGYTLPRQVQIKFEWVSSASVANAVPDKSVESLTIIAEEGHKTQVSRQHLRNGAGGQETITVLAHIKPGGLVVLDITEHSDTTARAGETLSNSSQTVVTVKDGETGTVRALVSKQGGEGAERALFVTPAIIRAGG